MQTEKINIAKDVLVSVGENRLQLCDIYFDSKIKEVKPKSEKIFDWTDLKEKVRRDDFLKNFSNNVADKEKFLLAIPGAIDPHVHFDTPGFEFREDFQHGSLAAAYGGVTTIIDMPCTSLPPVTSLANLHIKLAAVKNKSHVDYSFWGGIPGNNFEIGEALKQDINNLSNEGVAGFKSYMISGMETFSELSVEQIKIAAKLVGKTGRPLAVHAEDKELVSYRIKRFNWMESIIDWKSYCNARDEQAEAEAINKLISIAEKVDCKIHVVHLSSKLGLKKIRLAQERGLKISTETCPHYLHFTQKDFENRAIRNFLKTAPPVKFEEDKEELWRGLADGSISFVTTDHAGCDPKAEKSSENFSEVYGGIPGVEHRVPFLFSKGFLNEKLSLEKTIQLLSSNVADYYGLKNKGYLKVGYDADIAFIDLWDSETISAANMHSKGKYTPFEGAKFDAVVQKVFLRGNVIMDKEKQLDDLFYGEFVRI
jgi:allantoinase